MYFSSDQSTGRISRSRSRFLSYLEEKKANIGLNPPQNEIKTVTIDQVNFLATLDDLRPKLRERLIKEGINELLPL